MGITGGSARPEPGSEAPRDDAIDPVSGLNRWIDEPKEDQGIGWKDILGFWNLIEADMNERYGIDVGSPDLLGRRSARWLRVRILGLMSVDSRLRAAVFPPQEGA
jgi:hypothetical protein